VGVFRHPLPRVLAVTIALFAALWLTLPVLHALAGPPPPNVAGIDGIGTAKQNPADSCTGRPNTITFPVTFSIQARVLYIVDSSGETSGTINPDGTVDLTGQGESYHVISSLGKTVEATEVNGGCTFLTTFVLQQELPPLAWVPVGQEETATSAPATQAPVATMTAVVATGPTASAEGGGKSLTWVWITGTAVGGGFFVGGLYLLRRRVAANDCSKERERVKKALEKARPLLEAEDALELAKVSLQDQDAVDRARQHVEEFDAERKELDDALSELRKCLGEPEPDRYTRDEEGGALEEVDKSAERRSTLIRLGLLPKPGQPFDPVPPTPPAGSGDKGDEKKGDERKEVG
jgi:hypothetical protein